MAQSRGSYTRTPFPSALGSALLQVDFIAWGQIQVQGDLVFPYGFRPQAMVRGCNMLSAFGLSTLAHPTSPELHGLRVRMVPPK